MKVFLQLAFVRQVCLIGFFCALHGCVSIGFQDSSQRAKGLSFKPPPSPFQTLQDDAFDRAWLSQSTRSVISFKSDCGVAATSLDRILTDLGQVISSLQIIEESTLPMDNRIAQAVKVRGLYEGRVVNLQLVYYRKSQCNFLLSLQGTEQGFQKDLPTFSQFLSTFKSP
jgi:hypothetical protein